MSFTSRGRAASRAAIQGDSVGIIQSTEPATVFVWMFAALNVWSEIVQALSIPAFLTAGTFAGSGVCLLECGAGKFRSAVLVKYLLSPFLHA